MVSTISVFVCVLMCCYFRTHKCIFRFGVKQCTDTYMLSDEIFTDTDILSDEIFTDTDILSDEILNHGPITFLAHRSRRVTGELIGYPWIRRPSSVRSHFQTFSPLKPLGQSKPNFMWSLLGKGERKFV